MNYIRVFLLVFVSCIASCSVAQSHRELASNAISIDEHLFKNGVLHISLPEKHPNSFAIRTPNESWFVLQDSEDSIQILPQPEFNKALKLEFKVQDLKGVTWRGSARSDEIIFKEAGRYLLYFADNLETEPENTFSIQVYVNFSK